MKRIWHALCYRHGSFYAPYFWSNVFLTLAAATWILKLLPTDNVVVSDQLVLGEMTFIAIWEGVFKAYNYFAEKKAVSETITKSQISVEKTGTEGSPESPQTAQEARSEVRINRETIGKGRAL